MPSKEAHIAAAKENQATIDCLLAQSDEHLRWVVTIAFYKALHVVEALLAGDSQSPVDHTDEHSTRNKLLKTTRRYENIWRHYRPLWEASLIARYLRANESGPAYDVFTNYMPRPVVESMVLRHYLAKIITSAGKLLNDPEFLA